MPKYKTAVFDFDGVIVTFSGWKGHEKFGKPIIPVIKIMRRLKNEGWKILIWTTRVETPKLRDFLRKNRIPCDGINTNKFNPPCTSQKPLYHVFLDDRTLNPVLIKKQISSKKMNQNMIEKKYEEELYNQIQMLCKGGFLWK